MDREAQSAQATLASIRDAFQSEPMHDMRVRMYWAFAMAVGYRQSSFWVDGTEYLMNGPTHVLTGKVL